MSTLINLEAEIVTRPRLEINESQVAFYRENGYLVVEQALSPPEIERLHRETVAICRGELGSVKGLPPVGPDDSDDEVVRRTLCVHFPHKISPLMFDFLAHPAIVEVLTKLIGPNVKCMQSMLFIKSAGKPGQAWHQDEMFIPSRDRSLNAAWLALDDATLENGCLWVLPGSHRPGIIWPDREHDDQRFDCTVTSYQFPYRDEEALPVEVKAGSIVFFNGYLLHRSLPNRARTGYRRALVNHYMSAESLLPWRQPVDKDIRMATHDHRDIVMVAGQDPYAYKGIEEVMYAHIRRDREGGCQWLGQ
jgi:ectoine hydroxylase-related dioxygenase (phytanoyl-CoA dioxygenase family)